MTTKIAASTAGTKTVSETGTDRPAPTEQYVNLVKQILAGKAVGEPMLATEQIDKQVSELVATTHPADQPYPTIQAVQRLKDTLNLQKYYGGRVVACARAATEAAPLIPLAVGHLDIRALQARLTAEERAQVILQYPLPAESDVAE